MGRRCWRWRGTGHLRTACGSLRLGPVRHLSHRHICRRCLSEVVEDVRDLLIRHSRQGSSCDQHLCRCVTDRLVPWEGVDHEGMADRLRVQCCRCHWNRRSDDPTRCGCGLGDPCNDPRDGCRDRHVVRHQGVVRSAAYGCCGQRRSQHCAKTSSARPRWRSHGYRRDHRHRAWKDTRQS